MSQEFDLILSKEKSLKTTKEAANLFGLTVGATLGPGGNTQILRVGVSVAPLVTKDGATVARNLASGVTEVDLMLQLFRQAALNVEDRVGDGTTTTSILTADMINFMDAYITKYNILPVHALRDLNEEVKKFQEHLRATAVKVVTKDDMYRVAYISTNSDDSIAKHVADAISQIGQFGIFKVRDGMESDRVHVTQGYPTTMGALDEAYLYGDEETITLSDAVMFINDAACDVEVLDQVIETLNNGQHVVLVCDGYDEMHDHLLAIYRQARLQNAKFVPLKTSSYAKDRLGANADVAYVTQAKEVDSKPSLRIGVAKEITISKISTTVGFDIDVEEHVKTIEAMKEQANNDYDVERFKLRIARLRGGIAHIQVSGNTPAEQVERIQRYDDALRATQSAIRGGSVIGGGYSYLNYLKTIIGSERAIITDVMVPLMKTVFKRTLTNAGLSDESAEQHISQYLDNDDSIYDIADGKTYTKDTFKVLDPADTSFYAIETAYTLTKLTLNTSNILLGDPNLFPHQL